LFIGQGRIVDEHGDIRERSESTVDGEDVSVGKIHTFMHVLFS